MAEESAYDRVLRDYLGEIMGRREEIVGAFVAKYGFEPDEAMLVEQRTPTGMKFWIEKREAMVTAQGALERDRSTVASAYSAAIKTLDSYSRLIEGRGSYAWDDDRWKDEFRRASQQIRKALAPLDKVSSDLTNCPTTTAAVQAARAPTTSNA